MLYSEKAYNIIKKMILDFKINPAQPLSELSLAKNIGFSRTPVREALNRLTTEGLLASYNKRGYFLNIPTMKGIKDLYETRMILEGGAAKVAANRIDLQKLQFYKKQFNLYKDLNKVDRKTDYSFVKLGEKFHFFIIESTGNEKLKETINNIYAQIHLGRMVSYSKRRNISLSEHMEILMALEKQDEERSRKLMEEHIWNAFIELAGFL